MFVAKKNPITQYCFFLNDDIINTLYQPKNTYKVSLIICNIKTDSCFVLLYQS